MNKNKIIIGKGIIGENIKDLLGNEFFFGFLDDNKKKKDIVGKISDIKKFKKYYFFNSIGNRNISRLFIKQFKKLKIKYFSVISQNAIISKSAVIKKNNVMVDDFVKIYPKAFIDNFVIIEAFSAIGTYARINENTLITNGCKISSKVKIGKNCFIGVNTVVNENVVIADNVYIASGSIVRKNIPKNSIYFDNKILDKNLLKNNSKKNLKF